MSSIRINSAELIPWCERRGIDARTIVAETPDQWAERDGLHYRLRRHPVEVGESPFVEVVAPFDDPMPGILSITGLQA